MPSARKGGPAPTALFPGTAAAGAAGHEATIGKVAAAAVMVLMIYTPCDLNNDPALRKAACQFYSSWWLQNVSTAMLLPSIAGAYGDQTSPSLVTRGCRNICL